MSDIKWVDGAFCSIGGKQWKHELVDDICIENLTTRKDFQLNEIRTGDYIEAPELDTEKKYNDAVAVFNLFVFNHLYTFGEISELAANLTACSGGHLYPRSTISKDCKRKITYPQLMAIGKLKRAIIQRDEGIVKRVINELPNMFDEHKDYIQTGTIEGEKLNPLAESAGVETVCGKPKEAFVNAINRVNTLEGLLCTPQAASDCKELNINLVITGEGSYVLDCINGAEYAVYTKDDYDKVVGAIRVLLERER